MWPTPTISSRYAPHAPLINLTTNAIRRSDTLSRIPSLHPLNTPLTCPPPAPNALSRALSQTVLSTFSPYHPILPLESTRSLFCTLQLKKENPDRFPPTKLEYEINRLKKRWVSHPQAGSKQALLG